MVSFIITILIISSIGAGLALLLVLCEKYVVNYGPCKVTVNGEKELEVEGGNPLLTVLREEKIFIPSACGGRGNLWCLQSQGAGDGAGPVLATETAIFDQRRASRQCAAVLPGEGAK